MLTSLGFIFLFGLAMAAVFQRAGLPRIVGMLITGIAIGPYALNFLDSSILSVSGDLRQMALIIILLKAGLSLELSDLKRVGRPAVMMACVPASFEVLAFFVLAPGLLGVDRIEALVMGAVLAAVSPAVVVPRMVQLIESGYGTDKSIPQLILAGASCDDIFVIVLFSTFAGIAQGGSAKATDFLNIPVSIILGFALGAAAGWLASKFFESAHKRQRDIRGSMKAIILLGVSFLLIAAENRLKGVAAVSGLLAVVGMACVVKLMMPSHVVGGLSEKFGRLWLAAEVMLFVLVGAAVDIRYTFGAGPKAVAMIFLALIFRAVGVALCVAGTVLNLKERIFCVIAYIPKATVQAAIGSVPLSMGLPCGRIVLSVAVLGILITAPLGALGIDLSCKKLLVKKTSNVSGD